MEPSLTLLGFFIGTNQETGVLVTLLGVRDLIGTIADCLGDGETLSDTFDSHVATVDCKDSVHAVTSGSSLLTSLKANQLSDDQISQPFSSRKGTRLVDVVVGLGGHSGGKAKAKAEVDKGGG